MTAPVSDPKFFADFAGLAALRRDAQAQDPAALREAARQFESIFAKMMLSSMRQASFGDSLLGSDQQDFYRGMFDDQMAVELTRGKGLGLADMLVQQLTRAGLAKEASPPPAPHRPSPRRTRRCRQPTRRRMRPRPRPATRRPSRRFARPPDAEKFQ